MASEIIVRWCFHALDDDEKTIYMYHSVNNGKCAPMTDGGVPYGKVTGIARGSTAETLKVSTSITN